MIGQSPFAYVLGPKPTKFSSVAGAVPSCPQAAGSWLAPGGELADRTLHPGSLENPLCQQVSKVIPGSWRYKLIET